MIVPSDRDVWQQEMSAGGNLGIEFLELCTAVVYQNKGATTKLALSLSADTP
jgi:hypothetical protein